MLNLFPAEEISTEALETQETSEPGYRASVYFDFEQGDFTRDGVNRLVQSSGVDAWIQWCIKCLQTQRFAYLAYSSDYGIDYDAVFSSSTREEAENELIREINEALSTDPYQRLSYIESLTFDWKDDTSVVVSLVLVGIDGSTADFQTAITA